MRMDKPLGKRPSLPHVRLTTYRNQDKEVHLLGLPCGISIGTKYLSPNDVGIFCYITVYTISMIKDNR